MTTTTMTFLPRSEGWAVDQWVVSHDDATIGICYRDDRGQYIAEVADPDGKYDLPDRFSDPVQAANAIAEVMVG